MRDVIVIPTYNERENITLLVEEIFKILPDIRILVVDDNSPDKTAEAVRVAMKNYPNLSLMERPQKNGLGEAYIAAFKKLLLSKDVNHIITMDADLSHSPRYLPKLLEMSANHGLVIGSRYIKGGGIVQWELWRRILSGGGNFYVRCILGWKIRDWTAGFQCISVKALNKLDLDEIDLSGYAFLQELKYLLLKAGTTVAEVPIIFENRRGGKSKISRSIIGEGVVGPWKIRMKK